MNVVVTTISSALDERSTAKHSSCPLAEPSHQQSCNPKTDLHAIDENEAVSLTASLEPPTLSSLSLVASEWSACDTPVFRSRTVHIRLLGYQSTTRPFLTRWTLPFVLSKSLEIVKVGVPPLSSPSTLRISVRHVLISSENPAFASDAG